MMDDSFVIFFNEVACLIIMLKYLRLILKDETYFTFNSFSNLPKVVQIFFFNLY